MKTAQEIVDDANELARQFYRSAGKEVEEGYRFDEASHPEENGFWVQAVIAYEFIEGADVEEAPNELESE